MSKRGGLTDDKIGSLIKAAEKAFKEELKKPAKAGEKPKTRKVVVHSDGRNLHLKIEVRLRKDGTLNTSGRYIYRWTRDGKPMDECLGTYPATGIDDARMAAVLLRGKIKAGTDPREEKRAEALAREEAAKRKVTFKDCTADFVKMHGPTWTAGHREQICRQLAKYVEPEIGYLPVADITKSNLAFIKPLWNEYPTMIPRMLADINRVFVHAIANDWREADSPCHAVRAGLPKPGKLARAKKRPMPDLPYGLVPAFVAELRADTSILARAIEFHILCAPRSCEALAVEWHDIDWGESVWLIPPHKILKMRSEDGHTIPLTDAAMAVLDRMREIKRSSFVFPGPGGGRFHRQAMIRPVKLICRRNGWLSPKGHTPTPHGFRSSFRVWASKNGYHGDIAERALSHAIGDEVRRAYDRDPLVEERRPMMEHWAAFCNGEAGKIIPIHKAA